MDTKQFILDERKKGTSDVEIYKKLQQMNAPEIKQPSTEGPQRGFVGSILPVGSSIVGGIVGGAAGAPAGPAGVFGGAVLGAGLGQALGETAQQGLEEIAGDRQGLNTGQIAAGGVTGAGTELIGGALIKGVGAVAKPAMNALREPVVKFFTKFSGFAQDVVEKALTRSPGVVSALTRGEKALNDIITSANTKFHIFAKDTLAAAKARIKQLDTQLSLGGRGEPVGRVLQLKEANDFVGTAKAILRSEHNIGVTENGTLLFERVSNPSRVVSKSEQSAIQQSYGLLNGIRKDTSIKNIDSMIERMIVLSRKTPAGTPTGPESKAVINQMINQAKVFAKKIYPQFADEIERNFAQRMAINQGKELLGDTAYLSPLELSKLTKRMLQIFNSGNLPVRQSTEAIAQTTGEDIVGGAAGALIKAGDQISQRAPILTTRSAITKVVEAIPRVILENYAKTGKITGGFTTNPTVVKTAKALGITVDTLFREAVAIMQNNTTE